MPKPYAEEKIREALTMHNGNIAMARRQIMGWAQDDEKLLRALVQPHLDGIVAYQVERVASGRAEIEKRRPDIANSANDENFGMDLLRAVAASKAAVFGHENSAGAPIKRSTASKQHMDAIRQMASKSYKNKKET